MNKFLTPLALILAGALIAGAVIYTNYSKCQVPEPESQLEQEAVLASQEAGQKVIDFINNVVLKGEKTASLIEILEENGLYKVKFEVEDEQGSWRITKDGELIFPQAINMADYQEPAQEQGTTIGDFLVSSDEICKEDGKPIVYFFGSQSCPHCVWEHPIIEEVAAQFGDNISFHNNMDSEADMDVFRKYSTGGIPTIVLGCKYYRVGSGERAGEEEETKNLINLICELTENKPSELCPG